MLKKVSLCLVLCISFVYSTVNYPYPQRKLYGNSTINARNSTADSDLKKRFEDYLDNFYVTGTCSGGDANNGWGVQSGACARIKFTDPSDNTQADYTVSEGIGYAMLMAVYFSSEEKSYQTEFDYLWKYYKRWTNSNGLMNWKIKGFSEVSGPNAATDAEFDVALALAMARYQFGDTKYETDAKTLIGKIWSYEIDSDGLHKPGDAWDTDRNPSYVAPAAFEIFKGLGDSTNWKTALSKNYTFLKANQNSTTGLPSGWANANGTTKACSNNCGNSNINYDSDAVRAPWRWATANAWFGHSDAKTLLKNLSGWVKDLDPGSVKGPIALNGTMGADANASYTGSLMCALTYSDNSNTYQSKLNSFWNTMATIAKASYFNESMFILTGLLASGNMPNLKACSQNNCGTTMPKIEFDDSESTLLDKFSIAGSESEDDRGYARTWEPWYAYTDAKAGYENGQAKNGQANSQIQNQVFQTYDANNNCQEIDSYRVVVKDGDEYVAKIENYTLDQGTYSYDPFVGLGLDARNNQKTYDLSKCEGISYEYKGEAHRFKAQTTAFVEGSGEDHLKNIYDASNSSWTTFTVLFNELAQPDWVSANNKKAFDPKLIYAFAWELVGDKNDKGTVEPGISAMSGSLAIKNLRCLGEIELPQEKPAAQCGSGDDNGNPNPILSNKQTQNNNVFFANSNLNLNLTESGVLHVFDLRGNKVLTANLTSGQRQVSLANLPKGIYFAVVQSSSWKQTIRVVR